MANNDQADLESISSQLRGICISNDDTIQHLDSVHVSEHADVNQDGALFTPSKPILNTVCDSAGLSLLSTSPLEAAAFSTPQSDLKECCKDATCSVCLSPLLCRTALVETRCKHTFHEKCLRLAKGQKAECPNCRASLTPLQPAKDDVQPTTDYSGGHRAAIVARSVAARNAVRLGIIRRENERQRELSEIRDSNKENI